MDYHVTEKEGSMQTFGEMLCEIKERLVRIEQLLEKKKSGNRFNKGYVYKDVPEGYVVMAGYIEKNGYPSKHLRPLKEFGLIPSMRKLKANGSSPDGTTVNAGNPYIALKSEVDAFLESRSAHPKVSA